MTNMKEKDNKKAFKTYFVKLKRKLNLDSSLEEIIWLHLKSAKMDKPEDFDKGIKHFGYKV